jgi:uroporphyrinogen III methyltransferase/synthase
LSAELDAMRVVVTSPSAAGAEITELLAERGASVIPLPVFEIVEPSSWTALDSALERLEDFTWLLLTSRNAVAGFVDRAGDRILPGDLKIGAVGTSTAADAEAAGLEVDLVPTAFTGAALAAAIGEPDGAVLIARVEDGPPETPAVLRERGWAVEEVPVYRNLPLDPALAEIAVVRAGDFDAVTLMSPSAARGFARVMGEVPLPEGALVACIGPMTAQGAEAAGLWVDVVAPTHTAAGLVEALAAIRPSE